MTEPVKRYWQGAAPLTCDLCHEPVTTSFSDAKTFMGPWACMCSDCASRQHIVHGIGRGQRYERQSDGRWLKVEG
jgi:hypothetical protein